MIKIRSRRNSFDQAPIDLLQDSTVRDMQLTFFFLKLALRRRSRPPPQKKKKTNALRFVSFCELFATGPTELHFSACRLTTTCHSKYLSCINPHRQLPCKTCPSVSARLASVLQVQRSQPLQENFRNVVIGFCLLALHVPLTSRPQLCSTQNIEPESFIPSQDSSSQ